MSLLASRLSAAIRAALAGEDYCGGDTPELGSFCDCIADAVVAEITAHAAVTVTVPALGLVAPGGPGGPVTGAATGTGTVA